MARQIILEPGYWLIFVKNPGGGGTRYPQFQFTRRERGYPNKKPNLQRIGSQILGSVWIEKERVEDSNGIFLGLEKYDYVHPTTGRITDSLGAIVDLTKRRFVTRIGLATPEEPLGSERQVLTHDGTDLIIRRGQGPLVVI